MARRAVTNETQLADVVRLLQHILALELSRRGATQQAIAKHLGVAKATVVSMLKGLKNET